MMSADANEKIVFLIAGWLLGIVASIVSLVIKEYWDRRKTRRKLFTQLYLILEKMVVEIELESIWRERAKTDDIYRIVMGESLELNRPPSPPDLPKSFDSLLEKVAEWEGERGNDELTKKLISFKSGIEYLNYLYKAEHEVSNSEAETSHPLSFYKTSFEDYKEAVRVLMKLTSSMRLSPLRRLRGKFKK